MLSEDTPTSMNFKLETPSVAVNPNLNNKKKKNVSGKITIITIKVILV